MSLVELALLFGRLGAFSFGGALAVLAELQRELVVERHLITQQQFLDAYAIGQATPGPGVLYLVPLGFYAAGVPGAVIATLAFLAPPLLLQIVVASQWERLSRSVWIRALDRTLAPISVGLIGASLYTLGAPLLAVPAHAVGMILGAVVALRLRVSPAVIVLGAGVLGAAGVL